MLFSLEFLDSKQSTGTTHKYYDRRVGILSLLMGLDWLMKLYDMLEQRTEGDPI